MEQPLSLNLYIYSLNNPVNYVDPTGHMSWWQVDDLAKGIISSLGSIKDLFSWSTLDTLWETIKAVYKGKISLRDIARQAAGSVLQPFNYLIRNTNHVWKGKPSDKEVKQYGQELGNVLQMVAGSGGALKIMSKVIPGLQKLAAKLPKKKVRQEPKKAPRQEPRKTQNKNASACNCFTAGTKVLTDEGEKNIEDIEVGDMVLSRDESGESEEVEYKEVVQLFRKVSDSIYTIYVGDQAIEATGNHPFWVEGKGWLLAEELSEGDQLVQSNGNHLQVERITFEPRQEVVYNFEVARFHTYFVSDIGVWVHNENQEYCQRKEKGKDKTRQYFPTERAAKRAAYRDAGIGKHGKRKPVHEQLNPGSRHPHKSSNQTRDAWLSEKGHKVAHDRYGHKDPFDTPHFNVYFKDGRNYHYYYPSSYNPSRNK